MAYATLEDVQARIPMQLWAVDSGSQPTQDQVCDWLTEISDWVDRMLAWKYVVPVSDPADAASLKPIVAHLVAGQVWDVLAGVAPQYAETGARLEQRRKSGLAYHSATGRSLVVLNNTGFSDTGEAITDFPDGNFRSRREGPRWHEWGELY